MCAKSLGRSQRARCRRWLRRPPTGDFRDYGTAKWDGGDPACDHRPDTHRQFAAASTLVGSTAHQENAGSRRGYERECPKCGARRIDSQIGLEASPEAYVAELVAVFAEVRRVLKDDGTVWLNLGDSYFNANPGSGGDGSKSGLMRDGRDDASRIRTAKLSISHQTFDSMAILAGPVEQGGMGAAMGRPQDRQNVVGSRSKRLADVGLKPKDLVGIPWRVAFALQADGWYLRSDIIWAKPNPMPESVTDRPTKAHEYIFLLAKSERYYYDAEAIREANAASSAAWGESGQRSHGDAQTSQSGMRGLWRVGSVSDGRNRRSVWTVTTQPYPEAHFATYPEDLIEPCILAGSRVGDTVLDPFTGSGTTGAVSVRHQRNFVGVELNPSYVELARKRIGSVAPLLASEVA